MKYLSAPPPDAENAEKRAQKNAEHNYQQKTNTATTSSHAKKYGLPERLLRGVRIRDKYYLIFYTITMQSRPLCDGFGRHTSNPEFCCTSLRGGLHEPSGEHEYLGETISRYRRFQGFGE